MRQASFKSKQNATAPTNSVFDGLTELSASSLLHLTLRNRRDLYYQVVGKLNCYLYMAKQPLHLHSLLIKLCPVRKAIRLRTYNLSLRLVDYLNWFCSVSAPILCNVLPTSGRSVETHSKMNFITLLTRRSYLAYQSICDNWSIAERH